jgi:predicted enzyme related to lactoylglutathione lyase
MPAPVSKPEGAPIWIELTAPDADAAAAFYGALLGVTVSEPDEQFGMRTMDHPNGLIALLAPGETDPGWLVYLLASDVDVAVRDAVAAGGELLVPVEEAGELGRWAILRDPSGARVGLWEPWSMAGIAVENEAGAPTWFELHATTAYREAVRFYEQGLGWTVSRAGDSDEFRGVTFGEGPAAVAGISDGSITESGTPSRWQPSFQVADADAAAEVIRTHGGAVLDGPTDTPFGRTGHAVDPAGGVFAFVTPPAG